LTEKYVSTKRPYVTCSSFSYFDKFIGDSTFRPNSALVDFEFLWRYVRARTYIYTARLETRISTTTLVFHASLHTFFKFRELFCESPRIKYAVVVAHDQILWFFFAAEGKREERIADDKPQRRNGSLFFRTK